LVLTSVLACLALAIMPMGGPALMIICAVVAGSALQGVNPIIVAMSQRILPSGSRMASSLVQGWSWGVGGLLGLVVTVIDPIEWAFVGVGLTLLPAALLTLKLPLVPASSGVEQNA
jgi:hypothetical protein